MSDLRLTNLRKTYAGAAIPALCDLSLDIAAGEMVALLGPSGCGKTTALKLIAGLEQPSAGQITLGGRDLAGLAPEARGAVMVFQNHLLFPHMTVAQNVGFGLRMRGEAARDVARAVGDMLARVQLSDRATHLPAQLSGGQAQRAALARALILRPRVLLLDEPLAALDPHLRGEMRGLIAEVQADMGITCLLVTHDQTEALRLAARIGLILEGRLVQLGPARDFYRSPASAAVARFFGGVNFVEGQALGGVFQAPFGPLRLHSPAQGAGVVTLRPERVGVGAPQAGGARENTFAAQVTALYDLGTQSELALSLAGSPLTAHLPPGQTFVPGQNVTVHLPPEALWFMPAKGA